MARIAALMPQHVRARALGPEQAARLAALAGGRDPILVETLEALRAHPHAGQVEVLLTGWGSPLVTPALLDACPRLGLVAHCMGSVRLIVDPALFGHGVRCSTSAAQNAVPVAEFIVSWILRWNKRLPHWEARYRDPAFDFAEREGPEHADMGNMGRVVGVIGASRVGRQLLRLLGAFELRALLTDPLVGPDEARGMGAEAVDLDALMRGSDVVSINAPLLPETRHMIGAGELAAMRDGALLINTARGGLVDHDALTLALRGGRISAVLDVTEPEPLPVDSELFALPNVVLTPHVAGSLGNEIRRMTDNALDEVALFLAERRLNHEVGPLTWATAA